MKVAEIMTRDVEFVSPDATVQEAAVLMGDLDVGALPVGGPADLQGVVTDRDILYRVVTQGLRPGEVRVREVMSRTMFTCRDTDEAGAALDLMGAYHVRRLPVVNGDRVVVGWITLADIATRLLVETGAVGDALEELTRPEAA